MHPLRIHYLQHVPFEGVGSIADWVTERGHTLTGSPLFRETTSLPAPESVDWLIVMGGPMGVYEADRYPWMNAELTLIREVIEAGKVVIGICLGSQLIARALGANVYPGSVREIGWFPVQKTAQGRALPLLQELPDPATVFHWHGDTFDLPDGAVRLLESEAYANQAFLYKNRVLGLQFHFEMTVDTVIDLCAHGLGELTSGQFVQTHDQILEQVPQWAGHNRQWLENLLDQMVRTTRAKNRVTGT